MTDIKIDKNIPPPAACVYPFAALKKGESFLVDGKRGMSVRALASAHAKKNKHKYTVRKTDEGYRCWRIE